MSHKILFTASTFSHIANFHRPYLAQFARLGWEVHVACGGPERDIPEAQRIIHIPLEKSMTSPKNWQAVRLLRRMAREEGYALVSCHTSLASFFTRLAVMGLRERPLVACTSHGYLFDGQSAPVKRALLSGAERITAPVTDLLMTMNDWDGRYAQKHRLGRRTVQIPGMGVDFSRLDACPPEEGAALRRDLGLGPERFLFLYAAEFSPRKSQAHLIRALSLLPEAAVLALPGEGALREDCIRLSEELGLGGRVIFPGQVSDMPRWYAAADGAVSASRSEGLPFNIMEAMYAGLPIAASAVKGHTDLIRPGETGLLFPYGDWRACGEAMSALLRDRTWSAQLGAQAHEAVLSYGLDRVLPQVMEQYQRLLPLEERQPAALG